MLYNFVETIDTFAVIESFGKENKKKVIDVERLYNKQCPPPLPLKVSMAYN